MTYVLFYYRRTEENADRLCDRKKESADDKDKKKQSQDDIDETFAKREYLPTFSLSYSLWTTSIVRG